MRLLELKRFLTTTLFLLVCDCITSSEVSFALGIVEMSTTPPPKKPLLSLEAWEEFCFEVCLARESFREWSVLKAREWKFSRSRFGFGGWGSEGGGIGGFKWWKEVRGCKRDIRRSGGLIG